jgi:hypothetical protein
MHVDDLPKVSRLADDRERLVDARAQLLSMFEQGVDTTVPMIITSVYQADKMEKTVRVYLDQQALDAILYILSVKVDEVDRQLNNLGLYTYDREETS